MQVNCPHCQSPLKPIEDLSNDQTCPSCGRTIALVSAATVPRGNQHTEAPPEVQQSAVPLPIDTSPFLASFAHDTSTAETSTAARLADQSQMFGDYDLYELLGRGGMGVVYRARQRSANRIVALKLIRADRLADIPLEKQADALTRFRLEAQFAAQLDHAHLVTVYEVGQVDGRPFYSMKYVEGKSLHELLFSGPLENRRAARYLEAASRGVHEAHERGIVHRDLKPHNLMIELKSDRALVTDFGLAKLAEGEGGLSLTGQVFGTPPFMSPEQAVDSSRVTALSDVYSLGATLYNALTGRPPFQAATHVETLKQVMEQVPVSPRLLNAAVDRDLETICLKSLAKEPARRYGSALELADDLERYLAGKPIVARPITRVARGWRWVKRNRTVAALTMTAVLAIAIGSVVSSLFAVRARTEARRTTIERSRADKEAATATAERLRAVEAAALTLQAQDELTTATTHATDLQQQLAKAQREGNAPLAAELQSQLTLIGEELGRDVSSQLLLHATGSEELMPVAARAIIRPGRYLTLPAGRSTLAMRNGVEFVVQSETAFTLERPDIAGGLGIQLDYGRIVLKSLSNRPNCVIRINAAGQQGKLTLVDPMSIAAIEIRRPPQVGVHPQQASNAFPEVYLYAAQGKLTWRPPATRVSPLHRPPGEDVRVGVVVEQKTLIAPEHCTLGETANGEVSSTIPVPNWIAGDDPVAPLERLAAEFTNKHLTSNQSARLSLSELAANRRNEVRALAVRSLGHLGDFAPQILALADPLQRTEWTKHLDELHSTIYRGSMAANAVENALLELHPEQAAQLFRILWGYSDEQLRDSAELLVSDLDDDDLTRRVMSAWALERATGERFSYRPERSARERMPSVRRWRTWAQGYQAAPSN